MSGPSHPAGGVKAFSIGGRMVRTRQRCLGMTDAERQWRAQYLKDQVLTHGEPRDVPELYKDTTNFIRRLWKTPMHLLEKTLSPAVGIDNAEMIRRFVSRSTIVFAVACSFLYYCRYQTTTWTKRGSTYYVSPRHLVEFDEGYPNVHHKTDQEFYDLGFLSSPFAGKVEAPPPPPPPPGKPRKPGVVCPKPT